MVFGRMRSASGAVVVLLPEALPPAPFAFSGVGAAAGADAAGAGLAATTASVRCRLEVARGGCSNDASLADVAEATGGEGDRPTCLFATGVSCVSAVALARGAFEPGVAPAKNIDTAVSTEPPLDSSRAASVAAGTSAPRTSPSCTVELLASEAAEAAEPASLMFNAFSVRGRTPVRRRSRSGDQTHVRW